MTTHVPHPWTAFLLAIATFRLARFVGWDTITGPFRAWLRQAKFKPGVSWGPANKDGWFQGWERTPDEKWLDEVSHWRYGLIGKWGGALLGCPWCTGFWIGAGVWLSWSAWPEQTTWAAVPLVLSAAAGFGARWLDP